MSERFDVVVIGAGLGGVVCAALLAREGLNVLILDKNSRPGGKQMGFESKGFKFEMWPTYGIPMERGPFVEAFKALGIESKLDVIPKTSALLYRRPDGKWITRVTGGEQQETDPTESMFNSWNLEPREREVALKVLAEAALLTPEQLDALDDVTVKEWLAQRGDIPKQLYSFFAVHANLMATGLYELVAMSEISRILQIFGSSTTGFPRGGYSRVVDDILEVFNANGGTLRLGTRVDKILVEDGRATSVLAEEDVYSAPVIVSNAGIQPTVLKLVGEEHFDRSYVGYVRDIVPSIGFCNQRYIFSKPVMEHGVFLATSEDSYIDVERLAQMREGKIPEVLSVYGVCPAVFDPTMAPEGKQLLLIGAWCSPDPKALEIRAIQNRVDALFEEMFPEAVPYIESREGYVGPAEVSKISRDSVLPGLGGEAVGLAVTVGYCGKHKPSPKSPLPGLFFVGHDAGGEPYIGTHQAVSSGLRVAPLVHHYFLERRAVVRE
jgi:phytoene dehydrogenase-like protein